MRPFPNRSRCHAIVFATLVSLALARPWVVFAQSSPKVHSPQQPAKAPQPVDQEKFVSYWTTETGWSTDLQLRNNLESGELTVVPALRTAAGVETALPSITIQPGDVVSLHLSDALMKSAPQLVGAWGSLVLRYRDTVHSALYASVMVRAEGRPIAFHLDAFGRGDNFEVGSQEGIWWLPWDSVTGYLILTNSGDQQLEPNLVLYDSSGKTWQQTLSLGPRQTRRRSIRSLLQQAGFSGSYGGTKIDMAKGAGFLDSAHLLFEESGAFSAVMKMFKHDPSTTLLSRSFGGVTDWTTRAPMLALSDPDPALGLPAGTTLQPKVFIRNATGKTFTAHVRFNWRSATASGKSAPLDLAFKPNETQVIDVAALQSQKLLPADAHWASVILSAPVLPNELLAVAASYDQTGRYGAQTPFNDQLASHWEGGKWEVDSTHNSLVTIANGGNKTAQAQLTILYNQGTGQYQIEQTLAPDEQMALDFGKLIHDQVPDKNGHTLPPGLTWGAYRILDLNDAPTGSLYEGKVILDKTYGHASYGCMICCGPNNPYMNYDPLVLLVGGSGNQEVFAVNSCSRQLLNVTGDFPTWWTDDTSIATASGRQISGVAVGSTNDNAQSVLMYWGYRVYDDSCPLSQEVPSGAANVPPTVSISCGPTDLALGATAPADTSKGSCTATVSPTSGTYSWTVSTNTVSLTAATSAAPDYTAANPSTKAGDTTIKLTYTVNSQSATAQSQQITVHNPTSVTVVSDTTNPTGQACSVKCLANPGDGTCNANTSTCNYNCYLRTREYSVVDQFQNQFINVGIPHVSWVETIPYTTTCPNFTLSLGGTTVSGTVLDDFYLCHTCCLTNGPGCAWQSNPVQTITANGIQLRTETISVNCSGATITP